MKFMRRKSAFYVSKFGYDDFYCTFVSFKFPSPIYYHCSRDDDDDVERECIGGRHLYIERQLEYAFMTELFLYIWQICFIP